MTEYHFSAGDPVLLPLLSGTIVSITHHPDGSTTVEHCDETPEERIAEIQERLHSPGDELRYVSRGDVEWLIERVRKLEKYDSAPSS